MDLDVEEINNQVITLNETRKLLINIKNYQHVLQAQIDLGLKNVKRIFQKIMTVENGEIPEINEAIKEQSEQEEKDPLQLQINQKRTDEWKRKKKLVVKTKSLKAAIK